MILQGVEAGESSTAVERFGVRRETSRERLRFQTWKQQRNKVGMHMRREKWTAGKIVKVETVLEC